MFILISTSAFSQNATVDKGCLTIELNRKSIKDSLTTPVFSKGYDDLIQTIKHYIYYTDTLLIPESEFRLCDFWITLNKKGKITNSKIPINYYLPTQFLRDFPKLISKINYWNPSYQIANKKVAEKYRIFFRIEIYKKEIKIRLLNDDTEMLYEQTLTRPLDM